MSSKDDDDVYPFHGFDSSNDRIGPCDAFWERVLKKRAEDKKLWYRQGIEYWSTVDATVDGVLGGFGSVSKADGKENEQIYGRWCIQSLILVSADSSERMYE